MSSKFSMPGPPSRKPPICHRSPPCLDPLEPGAAPRRLNSMARWIDLDPLAPTDMAAYIDLQPTGPPWSYAGANPPTGYRLELECFRSVPPVLWSVVYRIYDPYRNPETFGWSNIYVDPDKPFDTGLLLHVFIAGSDYRMARVTA